MLLFARSAILCRVVFAFGRWVSPFHCVPSDLIFKLLRAAPLNHLLKLFDPDYDATSSRSRAIALPSRWLVCGQRCQLKFYGLVQSDFELWKGVLKLPSRKWCSPKTRCHSFRCSAVRWFAQDSYSMEYPRVSTQKQNPDSSRGQVRSPPLWHRCLRPEKCFLASDLCAESSGGHSNLIAAFLRLCWFESSPYVCDNNSVPTRSGQRSSRWSPRLWSPPA